MPKPLSVQKPHPAAPPRVIKNDKGTVNQKRVRSTKLPLTGKVIAVSTLAQGDSSIDSSGTIIALCKSAGAQYTAQVHRKVYCLVASSSAVKGATQRVRKAWKRKIPVVSIDWIKQCAETGKLLDMEDFRMQEETRTSSDAFAPVSSNSMDVVLEERIVELGCCCVCHESSDAVKDCKWCTDCVVSG